VRVSQYNADLRGRHSPTGQFVDLFNDFGGGGLEPGWGAARIGEGRGCNALSRSVHTTYARLALASSAALPMAGNLTHEVVEDRQKVIEAQSQPYAKFGQ
jgi:hypothetical protein